MKKHKMEQKKNKLDKCLNDNLFLLLVLRGVWSGRLGPSS